MSGFYPNDRPAASPALRPANGMRLLAALSAAMLVLAPSLAAADEPPAVDTDRDGLIEIHTIEDLNSVRYNLAGTSLKRSAKDRGNANGCLRGVCRGYELMANLDFDGSDRDKTTWQRDDEGHIILDTGDGDRDWFDTKAGGWLPIGDCGADGVCFDNDDDTDEKADNRPFTAVFEGNGYTISNLATSRDLPAIGLFGWAGWGAEIRNLGLVGNLSHYTGSAPDAGVGGLVGYLVQGRITNSYATGEADGGEGPNAGVGGLVGRKIDSDITDSYATGNVGGAQGSSGAIGGLVGWKQDGSITGSYATGDVLAGDEGYDRVGGLVGDHVGGAITACYATGNIDGGNGDLDSVGGLVGLQYDGVITASYATGIVKGGSGSSAVGGLVGDLHRGFVTAGYSTGNSYGAGGQDAVGGLVGSLRGTVTASYATGHAFGGGGDGDRVGGLVGLLLDIGAITASYATGDAREGGGQMGSAGSLVGQSAGLVKASWGFRAVIGGGPAGLDGNPDRPEWVSAPAGIAIRDAGSGPLSVWNSAADRTAGAWDFGTAKEDPVLLFADYDGEGKVYHCASDAGNAPEGAILIPDCPNPAATPVPGQRIGPLPGAAADQAVIDTDGDGLIEMHSLEDLNNMRYNLAGSSLKRSPEDAGNATGCPRSYCRGYELMADLDFDGPDDDTSAWTRNSRGRITLDRDDHNSDWFDAKAGGWLPIGDCGDDGICFDDDDSTDEEADNRPFTAVFDGNGHTIANLATARKLRVIGLFGLISRPAEVRNLGLVRNLAAYTGSSDAIYVGGLAGHSSDSLVSDVYTTGYAFGGDGEISIVGGLVGTQKAGAITSCYATGDVKGGDGGGGSVGGLAGLVLGSSLVASYALGDVANSDEESGNVGGLAGFVVASDVTACYASGLASGGDEDEDFVGGLVGRQLGGSVTASYAIGDANGGDGDSDRVGGLVGRNHLGSITAAFATGSVDGGRGARDHAGGLVGFLFKSAIAGSYATGPVDGGDGGGLYGGSTVDVVGGLVGYQLGFILASHATGSVDGGDGAADSAGGLVGIQIHGATSDSYATGSVDGGNGSYDRAGGLVGIQYGGVIASSHATGSAEGGSTGFEKMAGGLVGLQQDGAIIASYATGDTRGGDSRRDSVGGLVGQQEGGSITASYATGGADGREGRRDSVGGLVGQQEGGSITASYATGGIDGGEGINDEVGALIGYWNDNASLEASWGFGAKQGGETAGMDGSPDRPAGVRAAADIGIAVNDAGDSPLPVWNSAEAGTLGAWDFGTPGQNPALSFADYDGPGDAFRCASSDDSEVIPLSVSILNNADDESATMVIKLAADGSGRADQANPTDSLDKSDSSGESDSPGQADSPDSPDKAGQADNKTVPVVHIPNCTSPATLIPGQRGER